MDKIIEKVIEDFKRASLNRKEKIAGKYGFTVQEFIAAYNISSLITPVIKPIIHNVHILDASGSMIGGKIQAAVEGINSEILELKLNKDAEFTQTIVDFSGRGDMIERMWKRNIQLCGGYSCSTRGNTALYYTVGETLTKLLREANGTDKVLVKIFTDGQENDSYGTMWAGGETLANLIKECETKGFTITFVGTVEDVQRIKENLGVRASNMMSHNNTKEDIGRTFLRSRSATANYAARASRGEDVTADFFTKDMGEL